MQLVSSETKQNHEEIIDIGKYFLLLKQNWFRLAIFSGVVTILAILFVLSMTPKYIATATLLIESEQRKAVSIEQVVGIDSSKQEYYLTQFEILKSNRIAERVIKDLELKNIVEFNASLNTEPSLKQQVILAIKSLPIFAAYSEKKEPTQEQIDESIRQAVLKEFKDRLTISPIRKTQLVNISFESQDPKLAADVANAVGTAFVRENLESRLIATEEASSWITTRLEQLQQDLRLSETKLTDFLAKEKLVDSDGGEGVGIDDIARNEIKTLSGRLTELTNLRIELESSYSTLKQAQNLSSEAIIAIPFISQHPQVLTLTELKAESEKEISELAKRYGPRHEKMLAANSTLRSTNQQIQKVVRELVAGIDQERKSIISQERQVASELQKKKDDFQVLSVKKRQYEALKREVATNRDVLNVFLTRQKETSATGDFQSASARFTDKALVPQKPSAPKKKLIVAASALASLGFGVVIVFLLDALRNTIESVKNFEERFGLIPLGGIPLVKSKRFRKKDLDSSLFNDTDELNFSESIRSVRTALTLSNLGKDSKVQVITSSLPGEGKTTTSINLALAYAQMENTILVDCDLRKPAIAERFGYKKYHQGVTNHLLMGVELEQCFVKDEKSGLTLLPAGMLTPTPQEILSSEMFAELIKELESRFDRVIIDTPPTLAVADSLIVSRLVGSIAIVLKANSTRIASVKNTLARFIRHNIKIDGVIINQVSAKGNKVEYGYGGYYGNADAK
ncbi:GumC family protein [Vibrio sinaloensis]|uniref:GumC family protein n=1 Tax=Photobacterium sp. (strain ATCC 43367) TaxID=379097 RepID=UPI0035ED74A8